MSTTFVEGPEWPAVKVRPAVESGLQVGSGAGPGVRSGVAARATAPALPSGGAVCITPPATSMGGFDTVELGALVTWAGFEALTAKLDALKATAQEQGQSVLIEDMWGGNLIRPMGAAGGRKGAKYKWILMMDGVKVLLMNRETPSEQTPNVRVEWGSVASMDFCSVQEAAIDGERAIQRLAAWAGITVQVREWKCSRIDEARDLVGVDVEEFVRPYLEYRYVSRLRKDGFYSDDEDMPVYEGGEGAWRSGKRWTGLQFGKRDVMRIYDKLRELRDKPDPIKEEKLRERWGSIVNAVTRVEFQMRRGLLIELQAGSPADYDKNRAAIVAYLTQKWVRFTRETPNPQNTSRAETSDLWTKVQAAFADYGVGRAEPAKRVRRQVQAKGLLAQAVGCLKNALIAQGAEVGTPKEYRNCMVQLLGNELAWRGKLELEDYWDRQKKRRAEVTEAA